MRIIIICGSLEPGRDGVGDYSRRLAGELIQQGHEIFLMSIYDKHLNGSKEQQQKQEGITIPVLRIGASEDNNSRFQRACRIIDHLQPDWISLQYVPFSFHDKGLPWNLSSQLLRLGRGRKWHIMFHELWIGMEKKEALKFRLWGFLQKIIIKRTIEHLSPRVIHTQTRIYQVQIKNLGFKADFLPLFGNIPVKFKTGIINNKEINVAVFGAIQKGSKLRELILSLPEAYRYCFHFIGNNGSEKNYWMTILEAANIEYKSYNWISEREVSKVLAKCQCGLISTPYYLAGKSGAALAMLEHGLVVYCIARQWIPRKIRLDNLLTSSIINWNEEIDFEKVLKEKKTVSIPDLKATSENFLTSLMTNS